MPKMTPTQLKAAQAMMAISSIHKKSENPTTTIELIQNFAPSPDNIETVLDMAASCASFMQDTTNSIYKYPFDRLELIPIIFFKFRDGPGAGVSQMINLWLAGLATGEIKDTDEVSKVIAPFYELLQASLSKLPKIKVHRAACSVVFDEKTPASSISSDFINRLKESSSSDEASPLTIAGCMTHGFSTSVMNSDGFLGDANEQAVVFTINDFEGVDLIDFSFPYAAGPEVHQDIYPVSSSSTPFTLFQVEKFSQVGDKKHLISLKPASSSSSSSDSVLPDCGYLTPSGQVQKFLTATSPAPKRTDEELAAVKKDHGWIYENRPATSMAPSASLMQPLIDMGNDVVNNLKFNRDVCKIWWGSVRFGCREDDSSASDLKKLAASPYMLANLTNIGLALCDEWVDENAIDLLTKSFPNLKRLDLTSTRLLDASLKFIGERLNHLTCLNISQNDSSFTDEGLIALTRGKCRTSLIELNISRDSHITPAGFKAIINNDTGLVNLRILSMEGVRRVKDDDFECFADFQDREDIEGGLEYLNLDSCRFEDDEGIPHLVKNKRFAKTLKTLSFRGIENRLGNEGLGLVVDAFTNLESLNLKYNCTITDSFVQSLLTDPTKLPNLRSLSLSRCEKLTDAAFGEDLSKIPAAKKKLVELDLERCGEDGSVTYDKVKALRAVFPSNSITVIPPDSDDD